MEAPTCNASSWVWISVMFLDDNLRASILQKKQDVFERPTVSTCLNKVTWLCILHGPLVTHSKSDPIWSHHPFGLNDLNRTLWGKSLHRDGISQFVDALFGQIDGCSLLMLVSTRGGHLCQLYTFPGYQSITAISWGFPITSQPYSQSHQSLAWICDISFKHSFLLRTWTASYKLQGFSNATHMNKENHYSILQYNKTWFKKMYPCNVNIYMITCILYTHDIRVHIVYPSHTAPLIPVPAAFLDQLGRPSLRSPAVESHRSPTNDNVAWIKHKQQCFQTYRSTH